jgi:dipeptidyl aminopeptidase/acylaminoacyl peptidase
MMPTRGTVVRMAPMKSLSLLIALLAHAADGDLVERSACAFPAHEKVATIERYATRAEYENATSDKRFVCEKLTYLSGGLPVVAFLYRLAGKDTLPLIVFNRGSWVVADQIPLLVTMFHRLGEAGFAVLAPMYRGSEGAPGHDEFGGADLADLRNVVPLAKGLGSIDLDHVFLYGESRGGVMSLMALRDGFPARAAAVSGAFTDLALYVGTDQRAQRLLTTIWPDYEKRTEEIQRTRSAVLWAERIGAPVLLMHGAADRQVNPAHTFNLAAKLEEARKEYDVHLFGGDNHVISAHRVDRDRLALLWFGKHMN